MKFKSIILSVFAMASFTGVSSAVGVFVVSNDASITVSGGNASGRAIFVSTTADLSGTANAAFSGLLTGPTTSTDFDDALSTWLGAETPGIFVTDSFAGGSIAMLGVAGEAGDPLNFTYMFLVAETGADVDGIGVYTGSQVPALAGALFMNAGDVADGVGIGTSTGGFALAPVVGIPEPSIALLGALGVLGLIRRRR